MSYLLLSLLQKPESNVTAKELLDFTHSELSSSSRLHGGAIVVDKIPKNPSGKILTKILSKNACLL